MILFLESLCYKTILLNSEFHSSVSDGVSLKFFPLKTVVLKTSARIIHSLLTTLRHGADRWLAHTARGAGFLERHPEVTLLTGVTVAKATLGLQTNIFFFRSGIHSRSFALPF